MAALQRAAASAEIALLLECGADYVARGTQTLSMPAVYATLDAVELLWQQCTTQAQLSHTARVQGMQHFHAVHEAAARCVPLSSARWEKWLAGLGPHSAAVADGTADVEAGLSPLLQAVQRDLVTAYWGWFRRLHWGSPSAARAGLSLVLEEADRALDSASGALAACTGAVVSVEQLETALAAPLQAFARLSAESAHLFADHPLIGRLERLWLSETVGPALGVSAEAAVEALVRRSFKRDVQLPSAALPELLREYEESEVEERKAKDILAKGHATMKSSWMRAASALQTQTALLAGTADSAAASTDAGAAPLPSPREVARLEELRDDLLRELKRLPGGRGCLPALGLVVQRLLEDFGATTSRGAPSGGLSSSQTHFYLYLLHQWFAGYIGSHHRWSTTDMFAAPDDSDLWGFVLDRHAVCLTWALASEEAPAPDGLESGARRLSAVEAAAVAVEKLRAILYSVVHCLQLYLASVVSFTSAEKREVRQRAVTAASQAWVQEVAVEVFCRALLSDVLDASSAPEGDEQQSHVETCIEQRALVVEAELKLVMYDVMQMMQCPRHSTERLETFVQAALDCCDAWCVAATNEPHGARGSRSDAVLPAIAVVGRCLTRIASRLRSDVAAAAEVADASVSLYRRLVLWLKHAISIVTAVGGDPGPLWDEWTSVVAIPLVCSAGSRPGDEASPATVAPLMLGYAAAAAVQGRSRSALQAATSGGLDGICWERRAAAKAAPQGSAASIAAADVDEAGVMGQQREAEAHLQPPLKKPRGE
ncbi:hypothetical protein NESM_000023200 [Novymonas esmeraldas]|uniref:Uncharacterized protein n=1 Tax=Novymonas esmeraldas TaxID=1808958 RepID=A0AAW0F3F7_9TRYP